MKTARTKLLYLAMFAVIAAPCAVAYVGMKPILQLLVISILALFLGGRLVLYSVAWSFLLTAIPTGLLLVAGTTAISIKLLLAADPPVTSSGHPVMPIGQVVLGGSIGLTVGAVVATLYFLKLSRDPKWETRLVASVTVVLALALVADRLLNLV